MPVESDVENIMKVVNAALNLSWNDGMPKQKEEVSKLLERNMMAIYYVGNAFKMR